MTAPGAERRLAYVDSSALVKLVLVEPETAELRRYLADQPAELITSRIAVVEVTRAATLSVPSDEMRASVERLLASCLLVSVTAELLLAAARLASDRLRTLDAIHLATALDVRPDEVVAYDRRLIDAASAAGFAVVTPGL